jgi:transglutaminase-like putative cysteine protease
MDLDGDGPPWESVPSRLAELRGSAALDVRPFAGGVPLVTERSDVDAVRQLAGSAFQPGRPVLDAARVLCHDIYETFQYDRTFTEVSTPLASVLAARRGVCQDFAHLAVTALRLFGLAARYVSGYVETSPPHGTPRLVGADASHAWCSVWVPGLGGEDGAWVDFDPTNDLLPSEQHVTLAWGRDFADVTPTSGTYGGPALGRLAYTKRAEIVELHEFAGVA